MECAGKGLGTRCTGPPTGRCASCGAVAYCSVSHQDGEMVALSNYAHCLDRDCICKSSGFIPSVIAPSAGIAAHSSWSPTIELIKDMNIPAVFSNYCKEACHLGARCISSVTGHPLNIPIQLNPFRQPMAVEDSVLVLPCYSNCFLYGMSNWSA